MIKLSGYSFISQLFACMALALFLNLGFGYFLAAKLSQDNYILSIAIKYNLNSSLEVYYDTGTNFNENQMKSVKLQKGWNDLQIPFNLKSGEQLKLIRLDFGKDSALTEVKIDRLLLSSDNRPLFDLDRKTILNRIEFINSIKRNRNANASFNMDTSNQPFDPYVVFKPLNELMYSPIQRGFLLIFPWVLLFCLSVYSWKGRTIGQREIGLLLVGLFLVAIPLKIAWITFTTLLLLAFSTVMFLKYKKVHFYRNNILVAFLFVVPALFLGEGQISKLSIPLGFLFFPIISTLADFSKHTRIIKNIYIKVFLTIMSLIVVKAILLVLKEGYYYNIDWTNYFSNLRYNRHLLLNFFYYDHTTFISVFILFGQIFVLEKINTTKNYQIIYTLFALITLVLLGSRFAFILSIVVVALSSNNVIALKRYLIPLWAVFFGATVYWIEKIDPFRAKLWQISWNKSKDAIWFGHGTGNSDNLLPDRLPINKQGFEAAFIQINHSHNQFLTYMLENGIMGAIIALILFLMLFYLYSKQNDKAMILIVFTCLTLMIIESPFKTTTPLYLISFLFSIFPIKQHETKNE